MAARRLTLFQQAQKEIRRLEKAARRIAKRGYEFNLPFRFTKEGRLKTRYSGAEVERLKSLRARDLYKYSTAYGISGEEYRKQERRKSALKALQTRRLREEEKRLISEREELENRRRLFKSISPTVVDNFLNPSNWMFKNEYYLAFKEALEEAIDITSKDYVAEIIQEMETAGLVWQVQHGYKPEHFDNLFPKFLEFIKVRLPAVADRIKDLETDEDEDDEISIDELANRVTTRDMDDEEREFYEQRWGR